MFRATRLDMALVVLVAACVTSADSELTISLNAPRQAERALKSGGGIIPLFQLAPDLINRKTFIAPCNRIKLNSRQLGTNQLE